GTYQYGGIPFEHIRQHEYGMFVQDQFRFRPNVTINAGLRYEVQKPIYPLSSVYAQNNVTDMCGQSGVGPSPANAVNANASGIGCQFGVPGINPANGGQIPVYEQYSSGTPGYSTDYNNLAPSVGVAWQPNVQHGWLRNVLGDPALATVRGSYA